MADSDGEYVADDLSDDDIAALEIGGGGHGTRSTGRTGGPVGSNTRGGDREGGNTRRRAAWEDIQRSWDTVVEGADGSINSTIESLREAGKRKRSAYSCMSMINAKIPSSQGYFAIPHPFRGASFVISFSSSTCPSP